MGGQVWSPGVYLRMLLIGYFEGLDSERGIAWQDGRLSVVTEVSRLCAG